MCPAGGQFIENLFTGRIISKIGRMPAATVAATRIIIRKAIPGAVTAKMPSLKGKFIGLASK